MIGGVEDGIAMALTASLHISKGIPLEGSWDNFFYTREWNTPPEIKVVVPAEHVEFAVRRGRAGRRADDGRGGVRLRPRHRHHADLVPHQPQRPAGDYAVAARTLHARSPPPTASSTPSEGAPVPAYSFILNGKQVSVNVNGNVRLLWVLRDILGVTGPKYGCGLGLPGVHLLYQRPGVQPLCRSGIADQAHRRDHHDRRPARDREPDPAPDAAGLARRRRRPVRLLPARPDHHRGGPGQGGPEQGRQITKADLDGDSQHLPVRHLHPGSARPSSAGPRKCEALPRRPRSPPGHAGRLVSPSACSTTAGSCRALSGV